MCLGQVIMALVDVSNGKNRHICYRDSKLTFLLRVSASKSKIHLGCGFGGDCVLLLCISVESTSLELRNCMYNMFSELVVFFIFL